MATQPSATFLDTERALIQRATTTDKLTPAERHVLLLAWLDTAPWLSLGPDPAYPGAHHGWRTLTKRLLIGGDLSVVFDTLLPDHRAQLEAFVTWLLAMTRADQEFFRREQSGFVANTFGVAHHRPFALIARELQKAARHVGIVIPRALVVPRMPFVNRGGSGHIVLGPGSKFDAAPAKRKRFTTGNAVSHYAYLVWGRAGYMGDSNCDDPVLTPAGTETYHEARALAARMSKVCRRFTRSQADLIDSDPDLEWDGAQDWMVALVTLPKPLPVPAQGETLRAVLQASLASRAKSEGMEMMDLVDQFIEQCEIEADGASVDGYGSHDIDAIEAATDTLRDWLTE